MIDRVDDEGIVSGSLPIFTQSDKISGFWDETSQELTFTISSDPNIGHPYFYKGYLFSTPHSPRMGQDVVWTLAGYSQVVFFPGLPTSGALNARRNIFGWFAQITVIT